MELMFDNKLLFYAILLPGLMTVGTARLVSNMPGMNEIELTIFLLLSSAVNLAICLALWHLRLVFGGESMAVASAIRRPVFVVAVCFVSVVNGVLLAGAYENGWANRAVRWVTVDSLGLTKTTQHSALHFLLRNLYDDTGVFPDHRHIERQRDEKGEWKSARILKVRLKGHNTTFVGYEGAWSTRGQVDELYLSPACRQDSDAGVPILGAGVFIRLDQVAAIEFLDEDAAACARTLRWTAPVTEAKRLRSLEVENAKLKRLLADAMVDVSTLKEMLGKTSDAQDPERNNGGRIDTQGDAGKNF